MDQVQKPGACSATRRLWQVIVCRLGHASRCRTSQNCAGLMFYDVFCMKQAWKDRRNFDDKRRTKDGDIRPGRAGLTGEVHPPRIIADFLAVQEHVETPLNRAAYAFLGDACQDMYRRLLTCGAKLLMDLRLCATDALWAANSIAAAPKIMVRRTGE